MQRHSIMHDVMKNLKRILETQKEEIYALDCSQLCTRKEEKEVQLDSHLAQVVIGVRRSGKSTLCQKVLLESGVSFAYVNFDDERLRLAKTDDLDDILQMLYTVYGQFTHLFLDEIQNIHDWPLFVNRLLRQHIRLILTGSNANLLSGELGTHLTGRYHQIELFPFSFEEYCTIKQIDLRSTSAKGQGLRDYALDEYIRYGGFPELVQDSTIHRHDFLSSLMTSIVQKDVCKRYKIKYKQTLSELANKLLDWFAQEKSFADITTELNLNSIHTTKNYISYLSNAYLFYLVPKFSFKSKERNIARKVYAIDTAFISEHENALLTENYGLRLENIVAIELARKQHSEYQQIYYLRQYRDFEVDFVLVEGSHVSELIQVTYDFSSPSEKLYNREINGLIKGAKLTNCDKLTLIMMHGEARDIEVEGRTIHCVLASNWLCQ